MVKKTTLLWVQRLVWIYIYGGLLSVVLGTFLAQSSVVLARSMQGAGALFVSIGVVLIYVRSRLKETTST